MSENDDEYSGLSRSVSSETGNMSVSKCEIMVGNLTTMCMKTCRFNLKRIVCVVIMQSYCIQTVQYEIDYNLLLFNTSEGVYHVGLFVQLHLT